MPRFVRFVVRQLIPGESRPTGPFTAAYHLRREGGLDDADRDRLDELLGWFETTLTVPPKGRIPERAVFWFADLGPFSRRIWELARLLNDHGFHVERTTSADVGQVVYRDDHQLAAFPPRRRRR